MRLVENLLASELLTRGTGANFGPSLDLVRVGLHTVAGDRPAALAQLADTDPNLTPVAISPLALPVDALPIFESIADASAFKKYAAQERYKIAQQGRMLASKETEEEIRLQVAAAGYELGDWR
jgi:hypothetical protein